MARECCWEFIHEISFKSAVWSGDGVHAVIGVVIDEVVDDFDRSSANNIQGLKRFLPDAEARFWARTL